MKFIIVALLLMGSLWATISINKGSKAQLKSVKGIGEKTAQAIIDYRKKHAFKSIYELTKVKGIGVKSFKKMKKDLKL